MKLTAGDLFVLFNRASQVAGLSGYAGTFTQQSNATQKTFEHFKIQLEAYWPKDAVSFDGKDFDNYMVRLADSLDQNQKQKFYNYLNALGIRLR